MAEFRRNLAVPHLIGQSANMAATFAVEFQHGAEQLQHGFKLFARMRGIKFHDPGSAQIDELLVQMANLPPLLIVKAIIGPKADHVPAQRIKPRAGFRLKEEGEPLRQERPFARASLHLDQLLMPRQIDREGRHRHARAPRELEGAPNQKLDRPPPTERFREEFDNEPALKIFVLVPKFLAIGEQGFPLSLDHSLAIDLHILGELIGRRLVLGALQNANLGSIKVRCPAIDFILAELIASLSAARRRDSSIPCSKGASIGHGQLRSRLAFWDECRRNISGKR